MSYAKTQMSTDSEDVTQKTREVFREGNRQLKGCENKEERKQLLEAWKNFEVRPDVTFHSTLVFRSSKFCQFRCGFCLLRLIKYNCLARQFLRLELLIIVLCCNGSVILCISNLNPLGIEFS